ncbi:hypothetical protein LTR86_006777 [Recurvomyces mirabilis]|nr:hypothetical protein LTR86_006777 [Recurvomyces mirabilis]
MFRQHFEMKGLGCGSVTFAFDGWPGTPSDKKMNIQCWAGGKWDWQFDVSVWNNEQGKCAAACAIDAMLLDTSEFCISNPDICCYAGKCPS